MAGLLLLLAGLLLGGALLATGFLGTGFLLLVSLARFANLLGGFASLTTLGSHDCETRI